MSTNMVPVLPEMEQNGGKSQIEELGNETDSTTRKEVVAPENGIPANISLVLNHGLGSMLCANRASVQPQAQSGNPMFALAAVFNLFLPCISTCK